MEAWRLKMEAWRLKMEALRLKMEAWRLKIETWRACGPVVADLHHCYKQQDQDLHYSENSDPDPH
jgi:hypothetical protein